MPIRSSVGVDHFLRSSLFSGKMPQLCVCVFIGNSTHGSEHEAHDEPHNSPKNQKGEEWRSSESKALHTLVTSSRKGRGEAKLCEGSDRTMGSCRTHPDVPGTVVPSFQAWESNVANGTYNACALWLSYMNKFVAFEYLSVSCPFRLENGANNHLPGGWPGNPSERWSCMFFFRVRARKIRN